MALTAGNNVVKINDTTIKNNPLLSLRCEGLLLLFDYTKGSEDYIEFKIKLLLENYSEYYYLTETNGSGGVDIYNRKLPTSSNKLIYPVTLPGKIKEFVLEINVVGGVGDYQLNISIERDAFFN